MQSSQQICVSDRNKVEIDSVSAVRSFDEDGVLLESSLGKISVEGRELKIENFEKATGKIQISGNISGVFYLEKNVKKKGRGAFR
jgi:sporulation protein YabP